MSNSGVDSSEKRSRPFGLRLAIVFLVVSAGVGLFVAIVNLWNPFPSPFHLMGQPDFTTPTGLVRYVLDLVFILLFNLPLLYAGIATAFNFGNAATSIALTFASVVFGIAGWGLYRFKKWARLLTLSISAFTFLPILGNFPPFFFHSFSATTALLPFIVPYGLLVLYLRREDVQELFGRNSQQRQSFGGNFNP